MNLDKLKYKDTDPWIWTKAVPGDVPEMVKLVEEYDTNDVIGIYQLESTRLHYHILQAIIDQLYIPNKQFLIIARSKIDQKIIAWHWLTRGKYSIFNSEEFAAPELLNLDQSLPSMTCMRLVYQTLESWITWCQVNQIPLLTSSSIRIKQQAFMRLHEEMGFIIRGSAAYLRILK